MKKTAYLLLAVTAAAAIAGCGKNSKSGEEERPLFGLWSDPNMNYGLQITPDTILYHEEEMGGLEFKTTYQTGEDGTLAFDLPENVHGSLSRNPDTKDLTMLLDRGQITDTIRIPASHHLDLVMPAPGIAETYIYEKDLETMADTLRLDKLYPIVGDSANYAIVLLTNGKEGMIDGRKVNLTRSIPTPQFFENEYALEYQNLMGHPDRIEAYSFDKKENGKVGVTVNTRYYNGRAAQTTFYAGSLDGIVMNVTDRFDNYDDYEAYNLNAASKLEEPIEIRIFDCLGIPYIQTRIGKTRKNYTRQQY